MGYAATLHIVVVPTRHNHRGLCEAERHRHRQSHRRPDIAELKSLYIHKHAHRPFHKASASRSRGASAVLSPTASGGRAWIDKKCTIRCRLHPHKKIPGGSAFERPGLPLPPPGVRVRYRPSRLHHHSIIANKSGIYCSFGERSPPRPRLTFDSTLGPWISRWQARTRHHNCGTYNLNGTKGGTLAAVLSHTASAKGEGRHLATRRTSCIRGWNTPPGAQDDHLTSTRMADPAR